MSVPTSERGYQFGESTWWPVLDEHEAVDLRWPRSVELYDNMRRQDAQVMSVLRAVQLPIRRTNWRLDPNGADPEVVEHVSTDLGLDVVGAKAAPPRRRRGRFSWGEHLRLALTMLPIGHSFFEPVYRLDEQDRPRLAKLGWRPPRTILRVNVARDGGLDSIVQAPSNGKPEVKIPVDRLVAYVNDREGGNWLGQSLLRPAYKFWMLKDRALRTQAQTIERNGLGVPVYKASQQPDRLDPEEMVRRIDQELASGKKLAQDYRAGDNAGAAVPYGADIVLRGVEGQLPNADPVIRYYDEQIARAVLAHFLNLGTETGSWALGSTFADFFTLSLQTVALQIADVANQHIVEDLVDLAYGPDVAAPRIVFDEIGSRHPATADAIYKLVQCKAITVDPGLEAHLRTIHGLPQLDGTPTVLKPGLPVPPPNPPTGGSR